MKTKQRKVLACQNQHKDITSCPVKSCQLCWHSWHDCCFLSHCVAASSCLSVPRAGRLGAKHQLGWDLKTDLQYPRDGKSCRENLHPFQAFSSAGGVQKPAPSTWPVCQWQCGTTGNWVGGRQPVLAVISTSEGDTILKKWVLSIYCFLLGSCSSCWIPALSWRGSSARSLSLPRECSQGHLKHHCMHGLQLCAGMLWLLPSPLLPPCARDKSQHTHGNES